MSYRHYSTSSSPPPSGSAAGAGSFIALNATNDLILATPAGGGGSPGGSTTQIQFNNAGSFAGSANLVYSGSNLIFTGSFNQSLVALGSANVMTASVNGAASNMFSLAMTGSQHLANPINLLPGASYTFIFTQDGTGGRTLSYGTSYKWPGGITGSLSSGANEVDILSAITDGTSLYCSLTKDFS
tara:strand:+ start:1303 stop:1857 length:555 start_codon:yes stop_codon:yes gene_type:complete